MDPISVGHYWRMVRLTEEVAPVATGYGILRHAYNHLKNLPPSEEDNEARAQIISLIGSLEDQKEAMAQELADLWRAILELDGAELSSPVIESERAVLAVGLRWVERAMKHIAESWPVEGAGEEILMELAGWRDRLFSELRDCIERQREHQAAQAELLATMAEVRVAEIFVSWEGYAN